jgi:CRISPR/Cas system-associated exonuclease Cas4 (RecB family)
MTRGVMLEEALAEKYQTATWAFDWNEFVVVGEPDGITDHFVYEFKTTTTLGYMKPVAFTQADLYAYFFGKETKRVQIYDVNQEKMNTWEEPADLQRAEQTLERFSDVINGTLPPPPKAWKCKTCKFTSICPIMPAQ